MRFKYKTILVDEDVYQAIAAKRDAEHPTMISVLRKIFDLPPPPPRKRIIPLKRRMAAYQFSQATKPGKYMMVGALLVPIDWTPPKRGRVPKPKPEHKPRRGRPSRVWLAILAARGETE